MKLSQKIKSKIDSYFNRNSVEKVEKDLAKYGIKVCSRTVDDDRFDEFKKHIIVEFMYGSSVYGTMTNKSDEDIVAIVDDAVDLSDATNGTWEYHDDTDLGKPIKDYQFMTESSLIQRIKDHNILALEMLFLPEDKVLIGSIDKYRSYFHLDKWKLRQSFSAVSSNAYAKAHKKMTVEKDYDLYRGQKSLFHSIRVLIFGIQIAKECRITDYSAANSYWKMIYEMKNSPWELYKQTFKPIINSIRSEFVALCPKPDDYIQSELQKRLNNKI